MQCSSCDDVQLVIVDGRPAVRGECDLANAERIERWLDTFDGDPLEIDLSGVTFFDATALRSLLHVRRRNPRSRVVLPSNAVLRVLELTDTVDYLVDGQDLSRNASR
ncbi:MAG TPA: STAS domain-containing protein [Acidimicrobiales bacterium]|nr:STAS domain-containing protein [Acidimicrobiales bacterium]